MQMKTPKSALLFAECPTPSGAQCRGDYHWSNITQQGQFTLPSGAVK